MSISEINPRSIQDEGPFLPHSIDDLIGLRERLLTHGVSEAETGGIIGFVIAKIAGEATPLTGSTRARYRRILRELGGDDRTGDAQRRSGPQSSSDGSGRERPRTAARKPQERRNGALAPVAAQDDPDGGETPRISVMLSQPPLREPTRESELRE